MTGAMWSDTYLSWGRTPAARQWIQPYRSAGGLQACGPADLSILPRGFGRSYGDSCLNDGNTLLLTSPLDHFLAWDPSTGVLRAEAGTSLRAITELAVPSGWFLPVTPGTEFVSLGGAVANDVHGKNHHVRGTFGAWVTRLELHRSDGSRRQCSRDENSELFRATVGGLGLTGLITWVELRLIPIAGPLIDSETVRFNTLDEFVDINRESERAFEYTVAWIDAIDPKGRGRYLRGNHSARASSGDANRAPESAVSIPFTFPDATLNRIVIKAFNEAYYRQPASPREVHFRNFFYPLDAVGNWPRLYGGNGFFQSALADGANMFISISGGNDPDNF